MRFTETFARSSAQRPWRTVVAWIVLLVVGIGLSATLLGDALSTSVDFTDTPEAKEAALLLEERLGVADEFSEFVVVTSETLTISDGDYAAYLESLQTSILVLQPSVVQSVGSELAGGGVIPSESGRTVVVEVSMTATDIDQEATDAATLGEVVHAVEAPEGIDVYISGPGTAGNDFTHLAEEGLQRGEGIGVMIALIVLVVVFGTIVAAVVPVGIAVVAIAISMGVVGLMGLQFEFSFFVTNMITMIGLAVGIDYSLFIVSRYREERVHGLDEIAAISRSGATASRAVFFSGLTVVLALMGMFIVPNTIFRSLATGAIIVVLLAVAAALTLLPAVLSLLGDRIDKLRVPPWIFVVVLAVVGVGVLFLNWVIGLIILVLVAMLGVGMWLRERSEPGEDPEGAMWDRITHAVMDRPVISLVISVGIMVILAIPFFSMNTGASGIDSLPEDIESRQAFEVLADEFGTVGFSSPVEIVVVGEQTAAVGQATNALVASLGNDAAVNIALVQVIPVDTDVQVIAIPLTGATTSAESVELIDRLRDDLVPAAFDGTEARVLVGGETAFQADFFEDASYYAPYVFAFVLGLSFLLLLVVFRSIVVPLKAIILNLLSVFAAYGMVVAFFQDGTGPSFVKEIADLLSFGQVSEIEAWLPLFLFSILFGLSMDYHVFLLSRIRERFNQTGDNTESVAHGLRTTGAIITGAALIMVAVFGGFAAGELVPLQQMGFGLAVAVFLDATIVRSVLVPSSMKLLGARNWYLPKWLQWIPNVDVEGESEPEAGGAPEDPEREPQPVG